MLRARRGLVLVVVIAAVCEQPTRTMTRAIAPPANTGDQVQQGHQVGDIVPVSSGQRHSEGRPMPIGDQVVLAAREAAVDRRRSGVRPPFQALTWEPSIAASSNSSSPALRSCAKRTPCRRGHTPASAQSRRRRQQVTPLQPIRRPRSHPCAERRRCHARPHGHPSATGLDTPDAPQRARREQQGVMLQQITTHKIIRHRQNPAAHQPNCEALGQPHGSVHSHGAHNGCPVRHGRCPKGLKWSPVWTDPCTQMRRRFGRERHLPGPPLTADLGSVALVVVTYCA